MKQCPKCRMRIEAENECPICAQSLTYEKEVCEDYEVLILNKYLIKYLLKWCWVPLLYLIAVTLLFIKKPLEQKWMYLLPGVVLLLVCGFIALYHRQIAIALKKRYPHFNQEAFVGRIKCVFAVITDIILTLVLLVFLSMIAIPLYYIAFYLIPVITYTVLIIAGLIYVGYILSLLMKRRKFLRDLANFCENSGCKLEINGRPILNALFCVPAGAKMIYSDKTVELYFVSCLRRGVPTFLGDIGTVSFYHRIGIVGITLFDWFHEWQFCEKPADDSYILLMPAAKWVYTDSKKRDFVNPRGSHYTAFMGGRSLLVRYRPPCDVDNATKIGKSTAFTGGAFLRYMDRIK